MKSSNAPDSGLARLPAAGARLMRSFPRPERLLKQALWPQSSWAPRSGTRSRQVRVPDDVLSVCTADAAEAAAETAELSPAALTRIWHAVEALYRTGAYPAVAFGLRRRGRLLLNRTLGHAHGNGPGDAPDAAKRLLTPQMPVGLFSASKAITAVLVHMLAEEGGIVLDRPVAHYLPAFGTQGKGRITIAELLSHRGGIANFTLPADERRVELLADWDRCVALLCAATPLAAGRPAYHALTGGYILGELIQQVTGRPLSEYLDTRLRQPLGMQYFTYGLAPEHRPHVARNYVAGAPVRFPVSTLIERELLVPFDAIVDFSNSDLGMDAVVPAGNMFATAEELSRFYQLLLDNGEYQGKRLIKPATIERMLRPVGRTRLDGTLRVPMRYSEGFMLGAHPYGVFGPASSGAYGHIGFMNIYSWADPHRDISCSLLVTGKAVLGTHLLALLDLLNTVNRACPPLRGVTATRRGPDSSGTAAPTQPIIEFTA